jgi:hypothetical protein
MRLSVLLVLSVVVNVVLGLCLWKAQPKPLDAPAMVAVSPLQKRPIIPNSVRVTRTNYNLSIQAFAWRQIETTNYVQYIANLRGIGCPEETIRDIIVADVTHIYDQKIAALGDHDLDEWWKSEPDMDRLDRSIRKQEQLDKERRTLLTQLLGPGWEQSVETATAKATKDGIYLTGEVLSQLSPDAAAAIRSGYQQMQQAYQAHLKEQQKNGMLEDPLESARIRRDYRALLEKTLNPQQLEEFLLRNSKISSQMRDELSGFNTTPDEFRAIFRARDMIDRQLIFSGYTSVQSMVAQAQALQAQADATLKQTMGAERYQQYQRNLDPIYREARSFAEQIGAQPEAAQGIYELRKAITVEEQRVRNDQNLTPEQRNAELITIREQAESVLRQIIGNKAYEDYSKILAEPKK